ncbi:hypothetical protein [Cutibacterium sp.]|uniref:hypothetical protein n=1 Tax=Cutibacterium sp. TaxID=1912221 RepID=UPI0026DAD9FA|nr:hypothetical protein [Cutibacterium sp.]MDO4411649.1 hypothetical protein [Cutibacterium sp.]
MTNSDGTFAIHMKNFFTALGDPVQFDADPNKPEFEKWRIWAVNPDDGTYQMLSAPGNSVVFPKTAVYDLSGNLVQKIDSNVIEGADFKFGERIDNSVMHLTNPDGSILAKDNPAEKTGGQVQGHVQWNYGIANGSETWALYASRSQNGDFVAPNVKVYASYLSDYAVQQINKKYPDVRGSDWTAQKEAELQNWIHAKMAQEGKEKWIAETVSGFTGQDGEYRLRFNGTYGKSATERGNVPEDMWHTIADNPDAGSWTLPNINKDHKHINRDWLFVSTEDIPGVIKTSPFYQNYYSSYSGGNWNSHGAGWTTINMATTNYDMRNIDFAIAAGDIDFEVTPFNTTDKPAHPGDTAHTTAVNIPTKFSDNLNYRIQWKAAGAKDVIAECKGLHPESNGTLQSCDFTVPKELDKSTIYTAYLYAEDDKGQLSDNYLSVRWV